MNDFLILIQFAGATALVAAPAILIHRLLAGSEGGSLADLFAIPADQPWPRGVQEEGPLRWRLEMLHRSMNAGDRDSGLEPKRGVVCRQGEPMLPVNRSTP